MEDLTTIDFKKPYSKYVCVRPQDIAKQKVFFGQNGIHYDANGHAVDPKQIKAHYATIAKDAQKVADDAVAAAKQAQEQADALLKAGGVTKTAARK